VDSGQGQGGMGDGGVGGWDGQGEGGWGGWGDGGEVCTVISRVLGGGGRDVSELGFNEFVEFISCIFFLGLVKTADIMNSCFIGSKSKFSEPGFTPSYTYKDGGVLFLPDFKNLHRIV
jgi:hypothetical protein